MILSGLRKEGYFFFNGYSWSICTSIWPFSSTATGLIEDTNGVVRVSHWKKAYSGFKTVIYTQFNVKWPSLDNNREIANSNDGSIGF